MLSKAAATPSWYSTVQQFNSSTVRQFVGCGPLYRVSVTSSSLELLGAALLNLIQATPGDPRLPASGISSGLQDYNCYTVVRVLRTDLRFHHVLIPTGIYRMPA